MTRAAAAPRHPTQSVTPQAAQRGLTLVECLICVAITAISVGSVLPSFQQARQLRLLEGAAAQMATDLRHARSLAVAHRAPVRLSVQQTAAGSCYVVHTGKAGDCSCTAAGTSLCSGPAESLVAVGYPAGNPVKLTTAPTSLLFDTDRGTVSPTGTLRFQLQSGPAIHQVVNIMGRVRACSPGGTVKGYPAC